MFLSNFHKHWDSKHSKQHLASDPSCSKYAESTGIDIEATDNDGRTPLHLLCLTKCEQEVNVYKKMAANFNLKMNENVVDDNGQTPKDLAKLCIQAQKKMRERHERYRRESEERKQKEREREEF